MTDIPEMYLAEAVRRANARAICSHYSWSVDADRHNAAITSHAATLQELGWTPPIDEARMAKARKVVAAILAMPGFPRDCVLADADDALQAAYDALGED